MTKENISMALHFPNFKIKLNSNNPLACLKEIKQIVKGLNQNAQILDKINEEIQNLENPDIILNMEFSEEIRSNPEIIEQIDKLLQVENDYSIHKLGFKCKKILDLDNKHATYELELSDAEKNISNLFANSDRKAINYTVLILKGEYSNKDKFAILEKFKKHIPDTKIQCFDVKQPMFGKIAAEILFFGDF